MGAGWSRGRSTVVGACALTGVTVAALSIYYNHRGRQRRHTQDLGGIDTATVSGTVSVDLSESSTPKLSVPAPLPAPTCAPLPAPTCLPLVSVCIPVYNAGPFLHDCFSGILSQTYSGPVEVITMTTQRIYMIQAYSRAHSQFLFDGVPSPAAAAAQSAAVATPKLLLLLGVLLVLLGIDIQ